MLLFLADHDLAKRSFTVASFTLSFLHNPNQGIGAASNIYMIYMKMLSFFEFLDVICVEVNDRAFVLFWRWGKETPNVASPFCFIQAEAGQEN